MMSPFCRPIFPNGPSVVGFPEASCVIVSTSVIEGLAKLAWFQMLKKSVLNRRLMRSVSWNDFSREKSQFCWNGPRNALRPKLPKVVTDPSPPSAALSNGAGLKSFTFK